MYPDVKISNPYHADEVFYDDDQGFDARFDDVKSGDGKEVVVRVTIVGTVRVSAESRSALKSRRRRPG